MRRPKWIGLLLLALGVASVFAALAQWQIARAAEEAIVEARPTEQLFALDEIAEPGVATPQRITGQRVTAELRCLPEEHELVEGRLRVSGGSDTGWWLLAHCVTGANRDLPVVFGWSASERDGERAAAELDAALAADSGPSSVTGRFLPSEAPEVPEPGAPVDAINRVAVGELINRWAQPAEGGAYFGYVIAETPIAGLERIYTPEPEQQGTLNLLNVFYAVEWVLFAGFAVYLWYRLVKDEFEREQELAAAQTRIEP